MAHKKRIKVYRASRNFLTPTEHEKYLSFLIKNLGNKPTFYSIVGKKGALGMDCRVAIVTLDMDCLEDPRYDIMACCRVNEENIYIWKDRYWRVAQNKQGKRLYYSALMKDRPGKPHRHTVVLYEAGKVDRELLDELISRPQY